MRRILRNQIIGLIALSFGLAVTAGCFVDTDHHRRGRDRTDIIIQDSGGGGGDYENHKHKKNRGWGRGGRPGNPGNHRGN